MFDAAQHFIFKTLPFGIVDNLQPIFPCDAWSEIELEHNPDRSE
jgi:hypothetical protein